MLQRLERPERAPELVAVTQMLDSRVEAPFGQSELLGCEQRRPGSQRVIDRALRLGPAADGPRASTVERDIRERAAHVQAHYWGDVRPAGPRFHRVQLYAVVVSAHRHDQHLRGTAGNP